MRVEEVFADFELSACLRRVGVLVYNPAEVSEYAQLTIPKYGVRPPGDQVLRCLSTLLIDRLPTFAQWDAPVFAKEFQEMERRFLQVLPGKRALAEAHLRECVVTSKRTQCAYRWVTFEFDIIYLSKEEAGCMDHCKRYGETDELETLLKKLGEIGGADPDQTATDIIYPFLKEDAGDDFSDIPKDAVARLVIPSVLFDLTITFLRALMALEAEFITQDEFDDWAHKSLLNETLSTPELAETWFQLLEDDGKLAESDIGAGVEVIAERLDFEGRKGIIDVNSSTFTDPKFPVTFVPFPVVDDSGTMQSDARTPTSIIPINCVTVPTRLKFLAVAYIRTWWLETIGRITPGTRDAMLNQRFYFSAQLRGDYVAKALIDSLKRLLDDYGLGVEDAVSVIEFAGESGILDLHAAGFADNASPPAFVFSKKQAQRKQGKQGKSTKPTKPTKPAKHTNIDSLNISVPALLEDYVFRLFQLVNDLITNVIQLSDLNGRRQLLEREVTALGGSNLAKFRDVCLLFEECGMSPAVVAANLTFASRLGTLDVTTLPPYGVKLNPIFILQ